jgi:hypothetical protein
MINEDSQEEFRAKIKAARSKRAALMRGVGHNATVHLTSGSQFTGVKRHPFRKHLYMGHDENGVHRFFHLNMVNYVSKKHSDGETYHFAEESTMNEFVIPTNEGAVSAFAARHAKPIALAAATGLGVAKVAHDRSVAKQQARSSRKSSNDDSGSAFLSGALLGAALSSPSSRKKDDDDETPKGGGGTFDGGGASGSYDEGFDPKAKPGKPVGKKPPFQGKVKQDNQQQPGENDKTQDQEASASQETDNTADSGPDSNKAQEDGENDQNQQKGFGKNKLSSGAQKVKDIYKKTRKGNSDESGKLSDEPSGKGEKVIFNPSMDNITTNANGI